MKKRQIKYVVLFDGADGADDMLYCLASGVFHNMEDIENTYRVYPMLNVEISDSAIRITEVNGRIHDGSVHKVESFLWANRIESEQISRIATNFNLFRSGLVDMSDTQNFNEIAVGIADSIGISCGPGEAPIAFYKRVADRLMGVKDMQQELLFLNLLIGSGLAERDLVSYIKS